MTRMVSSAGILMLVAWLAMRGANAQQTAAITPPSPVPTAPAIEQGRYVGVASCAAGSCHGSPAAVANANILMNEYDSWLHAPAPTHVKSYEVLLNPLSQRIARNMNLPAPEKSRICLDCHTLNVPSTAVEIADGISCEACHGPAGGWRAEHARKGWSHADSVKRGMIDLRDLNVRARMCMSCHVGNATRQVNHELIAAGHPMLTFELDNFTESRLMPPHWKRQSQKASGRKLPQSHGITAWAVGQSAAFRQELQNVSRHAGSDQWPEFTYLSCDSCHHPLREGGWRQERNHSTGPGRPQWSPARWVILRQILVAVAPAEVASLDSEVRELAAAVSRMRNPQRVISISRSIDGRLARVAPRIEAAAWDRARTEKMIRAIARDGRGFREADRQSAEQAVYSLLSLTSHLAQQDAAYARGGLARSVELLYKQVDALRHPDEFNHAAFVAALDAIDATLR